MVNAHTEHHLQSSDLDQPDQNRAKKSAFIIGMSYIVGGIIPLLPYFFTQDTITGIKISRSSR